MSTRGDELTAAGIAAAGVLAVLLVQDVVLTVLSLLNSASFTGQGVTYFGAIIAGSWTETLTTSLPFAAGAFVALWGVAPIDRGSAIAQVVVRAVFAAGLGAVAVLVIASAVAVAQVIPGRFDFAYLAGLGGEPFGDIVAAVFGALQTAALTFVTAAPIVVLAGVMLWLWTRQGVEHPTDEPLDQSE